MFSLCTANLKGRVSVREDVSVVRMACEDTEDWYRFEMPREHNLITLAYHHDMIRGSSEVATIHILEDANTFFRDTSVPLAARICLL